MFYCLLGRGIVGWVFSFVCVFGLFGLLLAVWFWVCAGWWLSVLVIVVNSVGIGFLCKFVVYCVILGAGYWLLVFGAFCLFCSLEVELFG